MPGVVVTCGPVRAMLINRASAIASPSFVRGWSSGRRAILRSVAITRRSNQNRSHDSMPAKRTEYEGTADRRGELIKVISVVDIRASAKPRP